MRLITKEVSWISFILPVTSLAQLGIAAPGKPALETS